MRGIRRIEPRHAPCTVFHALAVPLCVWAGHRWREASARPFGARLLFAVGRGSLLVGAIVALAALCSLIGPRSGFTVIRLVAQALFAEVLVLAAFMASTEWSRSHLRGAAVALLPFGLLPPTGRATTADRSGCSSRCTSWTCGVARRRDACVSST